MRHVTSFVLLNVWLCACTLGANARAQGNATADWLRVRRTPETRSCPDTSELASNVERQLGRSPADVARRARVTLVATIALGSVRTAGERSWQGSILVIDSEGAVLAQRSIERADRTCAAMGEALAVIGALLLDKQMPPNDSVVDVTSPPQPLEVLCAANASVQTGLLPNVGVGGAVSALARFRSGPGGYLWFHAWPEQTTPIGQFRAIGTSLMTLGLGGCLTAAASSRSSSLPTVSACLGANGGMLFARGIGFRSDMKETLWTANLEGSAWLHQPFVWNVLLVAVARAEIPMKRDFVSYQGEDGQAYPVFRVPWVSGIAEIGVGYRFQ